MGLRSLARRDVVVDEQIRKLAGCDARLSQIVTDVARLLDVLSDLRVDADRLRARVSERDALIAETTLELSTLESERATARRVAEDASSARADAERALRESHRRAEALEHELVDVRDAVARQDRRLTELGSELSRVQDALADRDAAAETAPIAPVPQSEKGADRPVLRVVADDMSRPPLEPPAEGPAATPTEPSAGVTGHVLFAGSPDGYLVAIESGSCPRPGDRVERGARIFVVTRVGRSPLAEDERPWAFLAAEPGKG